MGRKLAVALEAARDAFGDQYEIDRVIGSGAMAVVFHGRAHEDGREVAVKVLRPDMAASLFSDLFHREMRILGGLSHPHVLPMIACRDADHYLMYVMPFAPGGSVRQKIARDGRLSLEETVRITRQVAEALDHLHAENVLHRDVKPENILFDADDNAQLCDFGLSRALVRASKDGLKTSRILLGTPEYMSPEQARGESDQLDHRTDLYALACVVYEMLAGEPPFTGKSFRHVIAKHIKEPPPRIRLVRPELPEAVERALERALAKDQGARPAAGGEFSASLASR